MTNEEFDKKWNDRYKERVDTFHNIPAPETRERLKGLETTQNTIAKRLEDIDAHLSAQDKVIDKSDLVLELKLINKAKEERDISNATYAPIIIKTIVYTLISIICMSFVTLLTAKVWSENKTPQTITK